MPSSLMKRSRELKTNGEEGDVIDNHSDIWDDNNGMETGDDDSFTSYMNEDEREALEPTTLSRQSTGASLASTGSVSTYGADYDDDDDSVDIYIEGDSDEEAADRDEEKSSKSAKDLITMFEGGGGNRKVKQDKTAKKRKISMSKITRLSARKRTEE